MIRRIKEYEAGATIVIALQTSRSIIGTESRPATRENFLESSDEVSTRGRTIRQTGRSTEGGASRAIYRGRPTGQLERRGRPSGRILIAHRGVARILGTSHT